MQDRRIYRICSLGLAIGIFIAHMLIVKPQNIAGPIWAIISLVLIVFLGDTFIFLQEELRKIDYQ
jgi:hypothetical protein